MIDPEIVAFVRAEIARAANVILVGRSANATTQKEDIQELFTAMATIEKSPVMHPYGFVSRAKKSTTSVVARQGDHIGNRVVLGHRDDDRPAIEAEGEVMLYNANGDQVYLKSGKVIVTSDEVHLTKENPSDAMALASVVNSNFDAIVAYLGNVTAGGNTLVPPPLPANLQISDVASTKVKAE